MKTANRYVIQRWETGLNKSGRVTWGPVLKGYVAEGLTHCNFAVPSPKVFDTKGHANRFADDMQEAAAIVYANAKVAVGYKVVPLVRRSQS
jgi:hypothetical protein